MDKDLEKKIKAVERASEIADIENMHGAEMAQGIEMNEEIEEKLALIKRLQSKLRFFRGTALAEVILLIIILLYSCGIFEKKEEIPVEVPPIEENVPDEYDIFLCADKPDFSLDGMQIYTPSDLINSVDSDFMALSDDCGGAYSYDEGNIVSTATCLGYAEGIRGTYSVQKREKLRGIVRYLDKAFDAKVKFLKKNNVPIVVVMAETAMNSGRDARSFRAFINDFANGMYPAYEEASGSGNVKASKVQQRLRVMYLAMCSYYRMKPSEEDKPFAKEIPLYLEGRAVDDLVGEAEPISGTTEWAEKSFGETSPLSEALDGVLGVTKAGEAEIETELSEEDSVLEPEIETKLSGEGSGEQSPDSEKESGSPTPDENVEINQVEFSSDVQSEESTENPDEVSQPALGVALGGKQEEQDADE